MSSCARSQVAFFFAEDREKISDLSYRAKSVDGLVVSNHSWFGHDAAAMGVTPQWRDGGKFITPPDPEYCQPLFPA